MRNTMLDNKVDLLNELPQFLRDFRELVYITKTEDLELQKLYLLFKRELYNQFIETANSEGLMIFEKLLGITIDETIDIETRRFNVATLWSGELPYTYKNLIKKLDILCGADNYNLKVDNLKYKVNITTFFINERKKEILLKSLRTFIPANMIITNDNQIRIILETNLNLGINFITFKNYVIGE